MLAAGQVRRQEHPGETGGSSTNTETGSQCVSLTQKVGLIRPEAHPSSPWRSILPKRPARGGRQALVRTTYLTDEGWGPAYLVMKICDLELIPPCSWSWVRGSEEAEGALLAWSLELVGGVR